jgi:hypothetical protein
MGIGMVMSVVICIWFTIGCTRDMIIFFQRLGREKVDAKDDGTVVHIGDKAVPANETALVKANPQTPTQRKIR